MNTATATTTHSATLLCPICLEVKVRAQLPAFHETWKGANVPTCDACRTATTILGVSMKYTDAVTNLTPPVYELRHRDGLVSFGGWS